MSSLFNPSTAWIFHNFIDLLTYMNVLYSQLYNKSVEFIAVLYVAFQSHRMQFKQ